MKRTYLLALAAVACGSLILGYRAAPTAAGSTRAAIDASKYADLQSALDALPESGGVVQLPPGEFELVRPLVLARGDVRIAGGGPATHLVNRNQDGQPAFIVRHSDRPGKPTRLWRVQLADFRVSGNAKSGDGLLVDGVNEVVIQGLAVDHHGGNGIRLEDCYENPRISNTSMTYNANAGLHIRQGHDIVVSTNHFEENQDGVRCIDSFNLTMNGNILDDHLGNGVVIENTCCSVVSGNMIEESQGTAIVVDRDCYALTVSSNSLIANNAGGVDLRRAWGTTVSANTFSLLPRNALLIGPNSGRIAVTGNNFSNSHAAGRSRRKEDFAYPPPGTSSYATGIVLDGTSDVVISGNLFAGLADDAIRTEGRCQRIVVSGNATTDLNRRKPATAAK
jgi:hypothetical protein